jgi:large subunit ribosomal protein L4
MSQVKVYNQSGKEIKDITLNAKVFGVAIKPTLVAEVAVAMLANQRQPYAHTKGRSEVRGGGRKPWKQKGTGRARHGSIRSPLWIGGGVTFGPTKNKNFSKKINKKVKTNAVLMVLSDRAKQNNLIIFEDIKFNEIKTKALADWLKIKPLANKKILIVLNRFDKNIERSARNIPNVKVVAVTSLNLLELLTFPYLVLTEITLENLVKKYNTVL